AGLPTSTSSKRSTSGPPYSWKRIALGMGLVYGPYYPKGVARSAIPPRRSGQGPRIKGRGRAPVSKSGVVGLARSNTNHAVDIGDEDLAVTDLARLGGLENSLDDLIDEIAAHSDLDAGFRDEVHDVLGAAVELRMTPLPPESLDLGDGHARNADVGQRSAHVVELEWLDDRGDQFHATLRRSFVGLLSITRFAQARTEVHVVKNTRPGTFLQLSCHARLTSKSRSLRTKDAPRRRTHAPF